MIFVDSSFLISLYFERDPHYAKARRAWEHIPGETCISEDILKETLTVLSQRNGKQGCIVAYQKIRKESTLLPQQTHYFQLGLQLFLDPKIQKDISLIDCISAAICKELGIKRILTFDRHFSRVAGSRSAGRSLGLTVLPK